MPTRRKFLRHTALGFGAYIVAWPACSRKPATSTPDATVARSPKGTFTSIQWATLQIVVDRILPKDQDPGAVDLGVPTYLDGMLQNAELDFLKRPLVTLLDGVERTAQQKSSRAFVVLTGEEQDEILTVWQKGQPGERHAFEVLLALTFEGAFGDPKYGGNRDGKGFLMVGFTPGPAMPHVMPPHVMPPMPAPLPLDPKKKGG
jgi:gluconate 2-dehydrogenase gamma chain